MTARCILAIVLLVVSVAGGGAQDKPQQVMPRLRANAEVIIDALRADTLAVEDPLAVFAYVLAQLPANIPIYPTENYFYFRFVHKGVTYVGNIRFAAANRDQGKVNFAYNEEPTDWNPEPKGQYLLLGADQGVSVGKVGALAYRIVYNGKAVTFLLNDLSRIKPPDDFLKADEQFLGPIFDESGMFFFLVFNTRLKIFHFMLDETGRVGDEFVPLKGSNAVLIGKRTGFAFYDFEGRKILIGVSERESRLNTYLDGPFDQLPENFIQGDALHDAILAVEPKLRGKIDRLGNFFDGSGRYLINPYLLYRQLDDLAVFPRCMTWKTVPPADRAACFVIDDQEAQKKSPRPLALKRAKPIVEPKPVQ